MARYDIETEELQKCIGIIGQCVQDIKVPCQRIIAECQGLGVFPEREAIRSMAEGLRSAVESLSESKSQELIGQLQAVIQKLS